MFMSKRDKRTKFSKIFSRKSLQMKTVETYEAS